MDNRPDSNLIRRYCDGEMTPAERAQFEQEYMNDAAEGEYLASQIRGERELKEAVSRTMADCPKAPSQLRAAVLNSIASVPKSEPVRARQNPLRLIFSDSYRANVLAVAATLALIAGAVLYGIFGRSIDEVRQPGPTNMLSEAAVFADREHGNWTSGRAQQTGEMQELTPVQAEAYLSQWLDTPVHVFDLKPQGYEFVGAGQCGMPVPAKSGHLIYRKVVEAGQRAPMLSVFLVPDMGTCHGQLCEGMDCGKWCGAVAGPSPCRHKVLRGTDGRLVYFLVCCDDGDVDRLAEHIQLAAAPSGH